MPHVNGEPITTLADWIAFERRAWYSAHHDCGLRLESMSKDEAASVIALDAYLQQIMRGAALPA